VAKRGGTPRKVDGGTWMMYLDRPQGKEGGPSMTGDVFVFGSADAEAALAFVPPSIERVKLCVRWGGKNEERKSLSPIPTFVPLRHSLNARPMPLKVFLTRNTFMSRFRALPPFDCRLLIHC
jgi:hypothetical protein